jgi:hypothetical protein
MVAGVTEKKEGSSEDELVQGFWEKIVLTTTLSHYWEKIFDGTSDSTCILSKIT